MTEEPAPPAQRDEARPSQRDEARAAAKKRRTKGFERREAIFDLFVSGFSHQQIAKALRVSAATVRRIIDTAVAERRLDAPERFARVQVARLSKALTHADLKLERGDIRAFAPYLKIVAALDRYHGLEARALPLRPTHIEGVLSAPPPLALPRPALPDSGPAAEVADFGA
jgi:transposase